MYDELVITMYQKEDLVICFCYFLAWRVGLSNGDETQFEKYLQAEHDFPGLQFLTFNGGIAG